MIKGAVKIGWMAVVLLSLTGMGSAAAEPTSVANEVTGKIVAITSNFISVEYKYDKEKAASYQTALPLTGSLNLVNLQSLKNLKKGDTVTVDYSDVADFDANGHETHKRVVTSIKFIKPASAAPASGSVLSD